MHTTQEEIIAIIADIRPYIQSHGGDVSLVSIDEGIATLRVDGACVGCPLAKLTYNTVMTKAILKRVPGITAVVFE